jgi:hypothetical protein
MKIIRGLVIAIWNGIPILCSLAVFSDFGRQEPTEILTNRSDCGCSSMVERQPSKLNVDGSSPFTRFFHASSLNDLAAERLNTRCGFFYHDISEIEMGHKPERG